MAHIPILGQGPRGNGPEDPNAPPKFEILLAQDPVLGPLTMNQHSILKAIAWNGDTTKQASSAQFKTLMTVMEKLIEQVAELQSTQKHILDHLAEAAVSAPQA